MTLQMSVLAALTLTLFLAAGTTSLRAAELGEPNDVEFKAALDGSVQRYVEMRPANFDPKVAHDLLIGLHGHSSDRWQYAKDARGECRGARDAAAKFNMIFVSPDYRAKTSWMGPAAEADLVQIISLLRTRHKISRVFLTGGSMGGASVLIFTALHPDLVAGAAAHNGAANMITYDGFQGAIAASYGGSKKDKPEEYRKRSPELTPERFKMPLAMTVGGKDTAVPPDSVRSLAAKLQKMGKKDLLLIDHPEGGHSTSYDDTLATIEFVIKAAAKPDGKKKPAAGDQPKKSPPAKKAPPAKDSSSTKEPATDSAKPAVDNSQSAPDSATPQPASDSAKPSPAPDAAKPAGDDLP